MKKILLSIVLLLVWLPLVFAGEGVVVHDPWIRWLPGGRPNSAAFMVLENRSQSEAVLKSVSSTRLKAVELHTMERLDDIMRMRRVDEIKIPAGGQVELKSGGLHLMVFGLPDNFQEGDKIDLTLTFTDGSSLTVEATARGPE